MITRHGAYVYITKESRLLFNTQPGTSEAGIRLTETVKREMTYIVWTKGPGRPWT